MMRSQGAFAHKGFCSLSLFALFCCSYIRVSPVYKPQYVLYCGEKERERYVLVAGRTL